MYLYIAIECEYEIVIKEGCYTIQTISCDQSQVSQTILAYQDNLLRCHFVISGQLLLSAQATVDSTKSRIILKSFSSQKI